MSTDIWNVTDWEEVGGELSSACRCLKCALDCGMLLGNLIEATASGIDRVIQRWGKDYLIGTEHWLAKVYEGCPVVARYFEGVDRNEMLPLPDGVFYKVTTEKELKEVKSKHDAISCWQSAVATDEKQLWQWTDLLYGGGDRVGRILTRGGELLLVNDGYLETMSYPPDWDIYGEDDVLKALCCLNSEGNMQFIVMPIRPTIGCSPVQDEIRRVAGELVGQEAKP